MFGVTAAVPARDGADEAVCRQQVDCPWIKTEKLGCRLLGDHSALREGRGEARFGDGA